LRENAIFMRNQTLVVDKETETLLSVAVLLKAGFDVGLSVGWIPVGRDRWGGKRAAERCPPRNNIGAAVWGESGIMTGVC
jgi:hypothetical protein